MTLPQRLAQAVSAAHPGPDGSERMLHRLPADRRNLRHVLQPGLHPVEPVIQLRAGMLLPLLHLSSAVERLGIRGRLRQGRPGGAILTLRDWQDTLFPGERSIECRS